MNSTNGQGQRPLSWRQFLQSGINRCNGSRNEMNRLLKAGDLLSCCQLIKYKLDHEWIKFLEECFLEPQFQHADLHKQVLTLDSAIVLTPNFDKIYDNFATSATGSLLKIKRYYDDDIPRVLRGSEKQRLILKIHGCIDTPDRLVFTREDYADIRSKYANFYRAIDALIMTHTFLFIGCSMSDPDISLLLEQYARSFGSTPPHYVTLSERISPEYEKMLGKNFNLRILRYNAADGHKELLDSVEDLNKRIEIKRQELASSNLW